MVNSQKNHQSGKKTSNSRVAISQLMGPEHANNQGNVHGGYIMKLVDEVAALACMRHAQRRVVTISIDQMVFREPIKTTDLVTLTAEISYVGNTSMEVEVNVMAENPITGEATHTNTAFLVFVALDDQGKPTPVPRLITENEAQEKRRLAGQKRQAYRLSRQQKSDQTETEQDG